MDSSKQVADTITAGLAALCIGVGSIALQAWLLTVILPWVLPTAAIGYGKAIIITLFLNLAFK